jgi:hypothetical protein
MSLKNPVIPPGIDPGTVRLVGQRLNHYATTGPHQEKKYGLKSIYYYYYYYSKIKISSILTTQQGILLLFQNIRNKFGNGVVTARVEGTWGYFLH